MKKFNKIFPIILFLFFVSGCSSTAKITHVTKITSGEISKNHQGTLPNGMSYIVRKNSEPQNRIQLRLVVKAGSCLEDDDQKGVAHFIEHLCFNGTEHFKKSAIVDYFESIGMKFGPEINAYTTYEQTVYMLEIPADNPEILKTSLMVLRDWACAVSFDQEEIDKERGVIIEEWRYRTKTTQGRYSAFEDPIYLRGSRFADRPVLGDMDIIRKISRKRIIDFYKKWYRPEFMSVIAIGDIEEDILENAVREVMETIPASKDKIKLPEYSVPVSKKKTIDILRDKETTVNEIYIVKRKENTFTTEEQYAWDFFSSIFNQRCMEITKSAKAEWINAKIGTFSHTNKTNFFCIQVNPKDGKFEQCFKTFLDELDSFIKYGPTESEIEIKRQSLIQKLNQILKNADNHSNSDFTNNLVKHATTGGNIFEPNEELYQAEINIINNMTGEKIRQMAEKTLSDRGTTMLLFLPEKAVIPTKAEIMDIWKNYKANTTQNKASMEKEDTILMPRPASKAKIKETKKIKELGATQYTFENGLKCIFKKTDFKNDEMFIYGYSIGGYYQLKENEVPSASVMANYMINSGFGGKSYSQLSKIIDSKGMSFRIGINNSSEFFVSSASSDNIEQTLQVINMVIRDPGFSDEAWNKIMEDSKRFADNLGTTASDVYSEKINEVIFGNSLYKSQTNRNYVEKLNQKEAERLYKNRFMNADDFTVVFTGDFDEKKLLDLCALYLGTLEPTGKHDELKEVLFPFPKTSNTITVRFGNDKKGNIYMRFGGELPEVKDMEQKFKENVIIEQLAEYLKIRLREVIREEKSGTYSVSTNGWRSGLSGREYMVDIQFTCEPEREEELRNEVIKVIEDLKQGKISDEIIIKLKETYSRSIETSLRNNSWWTTRIIYEAVAKTEPLWFTHDYKTISSDWITKENIIEAANKYLDTNRVFTAYLIPETK